ncbi:FAD-binding oxidoreductase [Amnibacterium kyonggiense]|uniref:FAD/FMN-containing dehydrogenase n=1 Tax=Amnibacterium kyonggiense TaxID=595671 RepID=A0A4R7FHU5_9MICO|nr:FAD-binding protein [Amnibacterium kyonggiense]TDS75954.1 FAD/FMN-containing dehydrogenase [Amnibacterium kyonggiense]
MSTGVSRRAAVATAVGVGMSGLLAACTDGSPTPPTRTATTEPVPTPTGPATWSALAAATTGTLLRPGSSGWDAARVLRNPRYDDADPLGILRVASAEDVAAGFAFARATRMPVALRAGGHSYTGWSAGGAPGTDVPRSLVISTADLRSIDVASDGGTVTIGPGARLLDVYERLAAAGRAIGAGSCATVGIGGLTLGGGLGVLVRSFGLTCDQLTAATLVTPDGRQHRVSATAEPDLFWACRGGGGGTVGAVTSLTFRTRPAPEVLTFGIAFPWAAAADVVAAWQRWAPTADRRLWSSLKLLGGTRHPGGPSVTVSGTWTGPRTAADAAVDGFIRDTGATPLAHTATSASYGTAMRALAGNGARASEAATSSVGTKPLDAVGIRTLVGQVEGASSVAGVTEGGVALDALGGAVADPAATDTAFPWRSALWTAQYTATFADGADPAPFDAVVRGFRAAMRPSWGDAAYANYCDAAITDPSAYFGGNTERLRGIARAADPDGLLRQPHWV